MVIRRNRTQDISLSTDTMIIMALEIINNLRNRDAVEFEILDRHEITDDDLGGMRDDDV